MASEQIPGSVLAPPTASQSSPLQAWLARAGLSGKLLAIGGAVGVVVVFFPLLSMSFQMQMPAGAGALADKVNLAAVSTSQSVKVVSDWRGVLCLLGYVAAVVLAVVLYPPNGLGQKTLAWAGAGVGGFIALLALWLLFAAFSGSAGVATFGGSFQISIGIGAILNLLAGAAVAAGGFLKAREEGLI
jgi:hypothetical protein